MARRLVFLLIFFGSLFLTACQKEKKAIEKFTGERKGEGYFGAALQSESTGPGSWKSVGKPKSFPGALAATGHEEKLYLVGAQGKLLKVDLKNGAWEWLGNKEFQKTAVMFSDGDDLFLIRNGDLIKVDDDDGDTDKLGRSGDWSGAKHFAVWDDALYTVESDGYVYRTNLTTGGWKKLGSKPVGTTMNFFVVKDQLVQNYGKKFNRVSDNGEIEGLFFETSTDGFKHFKAVGEKVVFIDKKGQLHVGSSTGEFNATGTENLGDLSRLVTVDDRLFGLKIDGTLIEIEVP
jgi:hypothetical protein